jgi:glycosyltransferase involved in cell wall biosynthesis
VKLSVVICARNEEARLRDCLKSVFSNNPDEIILVDGDSSDATLDIAKEFHNIKIIESKGSTLPRDRQIGIDATRNDLIAMIDADHRLNSGDLNSLLNDMKEYNFDIVQSGLVSYVNSGFWDSAEDDCWELIQNIPGKRNMVGTAPTIYHKRVFDFARFDDHITSTIEDTDLSYRLSKFPNLRFGVGRTKISQYHFSDFGTYIKKFLWYGKGDGEFCRKHPERAPSMLFHLLIRYPIMHSWLALRKGKIRAIPFLVLQGGTRFIGLLKYFVLSKSLKK